MKREASNVVDLHLHSSSDVAARQLEGKLGSSCLHFCGQASDRSRRVA